MQGVEQRTVDQIRRPNHCCRPDKETASKTSQAVASAERGDAEQELECPSEVLVIEKALSQQDICGVQSTTTVGSLNTWSEHTQDHKVR